MTTAAPHSPPTAAPEPAPPAQSMSLGEFIERHHESIARNITETYRPTYRPDEDQRRLPPLLRDPMGIQEMTIRGISQSLKKNPGTALVGEMGSGKTMIAVAAAEMAGLKRILVLCPPHLAAKWRREVEITLPEQTAKAVIARSVTDLERIRREAEGDPRTLFVIMKREGATLSHGWQPACFWRMFPRKTKQSEAETGEEPDETPDVRERWRNMDRIPVCPQCGRQALDEEGIPLSRDEFLKTRKKIHCRNRAKRNGSRRECGAPLWSAKRPDNMKRNRIGLAEYVGKKMKGFFQASVLDEVHEYKAKRTGRGLAAAAAAQACGKTLVLTGTLMGGYASTLFYLLHRFNPAFRRFFGYHNETGWVKSYGFYEYTYMKGDRPDATVEDGAASRRSQGARRPPRQKPGLMPGALFHLIENTAFIKLADVTASLPPYNEFLETVPMDDVPDHTGWSQKTAYEKLYSDMRNAMLGELHRGSPRLMAAYLQTMLSYPDAVTRGETAIDKAANRIISELPPLDPERDYPKEKALLRLVNREKSQGRRCLIYATYTGEERDITPRISRCLERAGIKCAVMKAGSPAPERREQWIRQQVRNGAEALVCNPRLVQTGLDLPEFPTIVWYQTEYSTYTRRQASRRSWRPGQNLPVRVHFLAYRNSLQSEALMLAAQKALNSMAVEGEIPEEGLSAYAEAGDNVYVTLAKRIMGNMPVEEQRADELQKAFNRLRSLEAEAEQPLAVPETRRRPPPGGAPQPGRVNGSRPAHAPMPPPGRIRPDGQIELFPA